MKIKEVRAGKIFNSREEEAIRITIKNKFGVFHASAPSGKSKGKYEAEAFKGNLEHDIKIITALNDKFSEINIDKFEDLEKIEKILRGKVGANTLFAFESAILKAIAGENNVPVWRLLKPKTKKLPFPIGNIVGGGLHSKGIGGKKPDFQEFLVIPRARKFIDNVFIMRKAYELVGERLKLLKLKGKINDENAWETSLSNEEVLKIVAETRNELNNQLDYEVNIGIDVAASSFFTGFLYKYENSLKRLKAEQQIKYLSELIKKFSLIYVEDPLEENAFEDFRKLRKEVIRGNPCLIVGDDLTVTDLERLEKAIKNRSIGGIIIKPNQNGSLLEVREIIELAKKNHIATIMSHRSGETTEDIIADLAFGFQTDFIKTGVIGEEREAKLRRLIQIEKNL